MKITDEEVFGVVDLLLTRASELLDAEYDPADDEVEDWGSTIAGLYSAAFEYANMNLAEQSLDVASYSSTREGIFARMEGMKVHSRSIRTSGTWNGQATVFTDGTWYVVEYLSPRVRVLYDTQDAARAHAFYLIVCEADEHAAGRR